MQLYYVLDHIDEEIFGYPHPKMMQTNQFPFLCYNDQFHRIRLGIGHPGNADAVSGYVLGRPQLSEREAIERSIDRFENAFPYLIQESKYKEGVQLLHHKGVL